MGINILNKNSNCAICVILLEETNLWVQKPRINAELFSSWKIKLFLYVFVAIRVFFWEKWCITCTGRSADTWVSH